MLYRALSAFCGLVTVVALIAGGCLFWTERSTRIAALVIEDPDRVITGLAVEQESEVEFRIHNGSGRTRRVVGGDSA